MLPTGHVRTYYTATAVNAPAHDPLAGEVRADICVVGAGYAGLSAALCLAERGHKVIVLEAMRVGWGASGRNGGQINTGYATGMVQAERRVGPGRLQQFWDMAEEARALIAERVQRHGIDCQLKPGYLHAAAKPSHMADFEAELAVLERLGYRKARLVDRGEVRRVVASDRFAGGLLDSGIGHLHPLNYALGLARAAVAAGVVIHEMSPVRAVRPGQPVRVVTGRGEVLADQVVLAGNAYLEGVLPGIDGYVMPVGTYIAATEKLGRERARTLIPDDVCVCDSNFVLDYFRRSADHRMLFGGRVSYTGREPKNLAAVMRDRMLRTFPQLQDCAIDFAWGGHVGITMNRLPRLGSIDGNIFYCHGFSGQGVALTGLAGKLISETISGRSERFEMFADIPHRRFPGGRSMRTPLLVLATAYYRLMDLF